MKKYFVWALGILFVFGCAPNGDRYQSIVNKEVSRLAAPSKKLSTFSSYQLNAMVLDEVTQSKSDKKQVATTLEQKIEAKISQLFAEWNSNPSPSGNKLIVTPELYELQVVSAGARFWVGGLAGESRIDMVLNLVDAETQEVVGRPRITLSASANAGGWTVGGSDKNLLNYVADISYKYLKDNY